MKKLPLATLASTAFAALAIGLAAPAFAADGTVALPPGGPQPVYLQAQDLGGANPYTPFGTNPYVPYGAWQQ
jgi:hypothetical protein